jgi:hypothetical protein
MSNYEQFLIATTSALVLIALMYHHSGWVAIKNCYAMWFTKSYWTNYNVIEALSWLTKAVIIVPGLIFGMQVWWLYLFALATSMTLIWASNKKLLPTLVGFNSLWIWISCMVLVQHIFN